SHHPAVRKRIGSTKKVERHEYRNPPGKSDLACGVRVACRFAPRDQVRKKIAKLIHGQDGHPVRRGITKPVAFVTVPHRVRERTASGHHQKAAFAPQFRQQQAQCPQVGSSAQASADFGHYLDHESSLSIFCAKRYAAAVAGSAVTASSPHSPPRSRIVMPSLRPTPAARKVPAPATASGI